MNEAKYYLSFGDVADFLASLDSVETGALLTLLTKGQKQHLADALALYGVRSELRGIDEAELESDARINSGWRP